jgi:anti-sigma regulatory factor (Ser/Thr protein kinase)
VGATAASEQFRRFAVLPQSVRDARMFVRDFADAAGADADAAELLASELATNAVRHARTSYAVRMGNHAGVLRVEIVNDAPELLLAMRAPSAEGGRGLAIVDNVAQDWGTESHGGEKVVWFELPTN